MEARPLYGNMFLKYISEHWVPKQWHYSSRYLGTPVLFPVLVITQHNKLSPLPLAPFLPQKAQTTLPYLKDNGLVVFLQVESKDIGVHQSLPTATEDIDGHLQELNLDPGHAVLLHLLHLQTHRRVQLKHRAQCKIVKILQTVIHIT